MKFLALTLSILITMASVPAFAQPGTQSVTTQRPLSQTSSYLESPLDTPLSRLLAQSEETSTSDEAVLEGLDAQILALGQEIQAVSLTAPIVWTSIGVGMMGGGLGFAVGYKSECDRLDGCSDDSEDTAVLISGIAAGVGAVTAIIGGIHWSSRLKERRKLDGLRKELRDERNRIDGSLVSMHFGSKVRHGNQYLTLNLTF
jgi:hypothetical protein